MARCKNKNLKKKRIKANPVRLLNLKGLFPVAIFSSLIALFHFFYPLYMDFKDGKWGGAIKLGVLNGENPELKLKEGDPVYLYYTMPRDSAKSRFIIPIQLEVYNSAEVSDQKVRLSIQYEKENLRPSIPEEAMTSAGYGLKSDSKHEIIKSKNHDYSVYAFESLPQKSRRRITDAAFSSKTEEREGIIPLFISRYGVNILATTHSHRDKERNWIFRYRGLAVSNEEKVELWMKEWHSKQIAIDLRQDSTFIEYLLGIVFDKKVIVYAFSPKFSYIKTLDLYTPQEDPKEYKVFKFSPYVWGLLF